MLDNVKYFKFDNVKSQAIIKKMDVVLFVSACMIFALSVIVREIWEEL